MKPTLEGSTEQLMRCIREWDQAMIRNDTQLMGHYMAEDWIIIGSDGSTGDKASFLRLVETGDLSHDVMESSDVHIREYGDTAVVTSRGISGGMFQGRPFRELERVSCVFLRQEGQWRCVLTHLSKLPAEAGSAVV